MTEDKSESAPADYGTAWVRVSVNAGAEVTHVGPPLNDEKFPQRRWGASFSFVMPKTAIDALVDRYYAQGRLPRNLYRYSSAVGVV